MKRIAPILLLLLLTIPCFAQESWLGIYLKGQKIGYTGYVASAMPNLEKPSTRQTITRISGTMLGQSLEMSLESTTWYASTGKVSKMKFLLESGGRKIKTTADFGPTTIEATLDADGNISKKSIGIPSDGPISDDPVADIVLESGTAKKVYIFDPQTLTLVPNEVAAPVPTKIQVGGKTVDATLIKIDDPRAPSLLYFSAKGDLIRAEGPFGIQMIPEPKLVAMNLASSGSQDSGISDIAGASSIVPDRAIDDPYNRPSLKLLIEGSILPSLPSDDHQTVTKTSQGLEITIHPFQKPDVTTTISEAAHGQPNWIKPDVRVPSNKPIFAKRALAVIGGEKKVVAATEKIRRYVNGLLTVNAGIGVMRDATEILTSPEGVCRDHSILMAALLRSIHIPTRLVGGMVYADGAFYYHAWVEVWDGQHWYGVDSTRPETFVTAVHVKTAQGTVSEAYTAFLLGDAKIVVLTGKESQ